MNIICIDPSLTCTAVVVNGKHAVFASQDRAFTKTMRMNKWFEITKPHCEYFFHTLGQPKLSYAQTELDKIHNYDKITDAIVDYVQSHCDPSQDSNVYIEGYSFSSAAGPIIDLTTFGTLLRSKLYWKVSRNLRILAPTELKLYAAKLTYPEVIEKKKSVWRNKAGISGGAFTKPDMYKSLTENEGIVDEYVEFLRTNSVEILGLKEIPKPIEDLNDAKLMFEVAKADKYT